MSAPSLVTRSIDAKTHILDTAQRLIGSRGFSAVGLNEILATSGVPKGSFYHYFSSKEAFGKQLLDHYFEKYLVEIDGFLSNEAMNGRQRLAAYWAYWRDNQERQDPEGKCLAVKLGAEVSDLSEEMRSALKVGTSAIIQRLAQVIEDGVNDGSLAIEGSPTTSAHELYQLWMGASVMAKITRESIPFDTAFAAADRLVTSAFPRASRNRRA